MPEGNPDYKADFNDTTDKVEEEKSRARNRISESIVQLYVWCIGVLIFLFFMSFFATALGNYDHSQVLNNYEDFVKTLVLPVVTFILGFYYASKN